MPIDAAQLMVTIRTNAAQAKSELMGFGATMAKGGAVPTMVGVGAGVILAAGVAVAAVSVKMAGDFQAGIVTLKTGAGELQQNMGLVSSGILKLATDTGTSTSQLISGMFMIESAGYHGQAGLDVLKAAAEGAKVGNADLGTTANAVTTIMVDYGLKANQAAMATNSLIATVASGKTHMEDLAASLSTVLPAAASAGIGLNDVMAAMATQTAAGVDAANAATHLRQLILSLEAPSTKASKVLREMGLTTDQISAEMKISLPGALKMIEDAVAQHFKPGSAEYIAAMAEISGGTRQMQGMLALTGQHMTTFANDAKAIALQVRQGGKSVQGWSDVQQTFNYQMSRAGAEVETLFIRLGMHLLPVATQFVGYLVNNVVPAIANFVSWLNSGSAQANTVKGILIVLSIAIAGALVAAFVAWAVAATAAAIATIAATWPILAIGAAIALLITGIVLLVTHWGEIKKNFADGAFGKGVLAVLKSMWDMITGLVGKLGNLKDALGKAFGVGSSGGFHLPGFASGGTLPEGWALVGEQGPELVRAPGATVFPMPGGLGGGGGVGGALTITVPLYVDGHQLARTTAKYLPGVIRGATGQRAF